MKPHIQNHALMNVWCNPGQDTQIILKAAKVSKPNGEYLSMILMDRRLSMPTADTSYHVYQVGGVVPPSLGLPGDQKGSEWSSFTEAVVKKDLVANIYTAAGFLVPLYRAYYKYTREGALVFAVDLKSIDAAALLTKHVYLRLYTNAWYGSEVGSSLAVRTFSAGQNLVNNMSIVSLRSALSPFESLPGQVFGFLNGEFVEPLNATTMRVGDTAEFIYDASVKRMVEWRIGDLNTFTSTLDESYKYLLHYPGRGEDQIDFVDDIDLFVVHKKERSVIGRYVPRNMAKTMRMVSHKDYSVDVSNLNWVADALAASVGEGVSSEDLYLRAYIRNSGTIRPLIKEANRLFELYKLDDAHVSAALLGAESTVSFWRAPALESSGYCKVMGQLSKAFDQGDLEDCYGYNGMSVVLGSTPSKVNPDKNQYFTIPPAYQKSSVVFEYDEDGHLIDFHQHAASALWLIQSDRTRLIEFVSGTGGKNLGNSYGTHLLAVPQNEDYRVYMCSIVEGIPNRKWVDITGSGFYDVVDGILRWTASESGQYLMVRRASAVLSYAVNLQAIAGTFYFDLTEEDNEGRVRELEVPFANLDVWSNGQSLIEGIGFVYKHPRLFIVDKNALSQPAGSTTQKFVVRGYGFDDQGIQERLINDRGFVIHGVLSENTRFDIRDDKVLRIVVGGSVKSRDDLLFSESHSGVSIINSLNGQPYQIKELIVPLEGYTRSETYSLLSSSNARDKAVSDYMSRMYPAFVRGAVSTIQSRYTVYSPFISHIVNDLVSGQFNLGDIKKELSDSDVVALCKSYEPLLEFDPINEGLGFSRNFVLIHPHQLDRRIELDMYAYVFVGRVVKLYAKGLVDISHHLFIKNSGVNI